MSFFQLLFISPSVCPAHSQTTFPKRRGAEEHTSLSRAACVLTKQHLLPPCLTKWPIKVPWKSHPKPWQLILSHLKDKTWGFTAGTRTVEWLVQASSGSWGQISTCPSVQLSDQVKAVWSAQDGTAWRGAWLTAGTDSQGAAPPVRLQGDASGSSFRGKI